ncbi:MAG: hypothetical protein J3K34DRAFT_430972 [Monoraphidium minutum]|nr:MAG: hypothetical protein J3K34DRAFT_430972 [Monoraphidium minutum]
MRRAQWPRGSKGALRRRRREAGWSEGSPHRAASGLGGRQAAAALAEEGARAAAGLNKKKGSRDANDINHAPAQPPPSVWRRPARRPLRPPLRPRLAPAPGRRLLRPSKQARGRAACALALDTSPAEGWGAARRRGGSAPQAGGTTLYRASAPGSGWNHAEARRNRWEQGGAGAGGGAPPPARVAASPCGTSDARCARGCARARAAHSKHEDVRRGGGSIGVGRRQEPGRLAGIAGDMGTGRWEGAAPRRGTARAWRRGPGGSGWQRVSRGAQGGAAKGSKAWLVRSGQARPARGRQLWDVGRRPRARASASARQRRRRSAARGPQSGGARPAQTRAGARSLGPPGSQPTPV